MNDTATFVHLDIHTEYSLSDGLIRVDALIKAAVQMRMPALAVTDRANLFSAIKFYQAARSAGIKPILGCACWLENPKNQNSPFSITLLCQNNQGYQNLIELVTQSYLQSVSKPWLKIDWLTEQTTQGLLILLGNESDVGQAVLGQQTSLSEQCLAHWRTLFSGRLYLQIQRTESKGEEIYIHAACQWAQRDHIPIVASNAVCFLSPEDYEAHEARVCIHEGSFVSDSKRLRLYSAKQYLRSPQEMIELFSDIPSAIVHSVEIAKRCNLNLTLDHFYLPHYAVTPEILVEDYLIAQAQQGLKQRGTTTSIYQERLAEELTVINSMGFAGYFLIVADFIDWAKQNDIPVGPGRGSGAGSLVAYALGITDVDPLPYDLLFERFLNPERISMPDFDIDFCIEGRDRVIAYVVARYGRDSVAQIITYGRMAAKAVVRDVGRVLGYPYNMVDQLAKLIPFELGITLEKALTQKELKARYQEEEDVKRLIDLALKLEGLVRNAGKHAGGVVIAPSKLTNFTPLYCEPGQPHHAVTQFDKNDIERVGLIKFDFLGLKTLTMIHSAVRCINRMRGDVDEIKIDQIPKDDSKTFDLLKACKTIGVFQLESRGMRELVRNLKPDCLNDLVALVALFRPGPLQSGMVDDFIARKQNKSEITYLHPLLEPILKATYGIILYQEQVMQIAQHLAGYTLGSADLLRKAMGKKKHKEMKKHRAIFMKGAQERGINEQTAHQIFDLMENFADYGFNKSHSVAYALITYQTAWLKANYPEQFMAAVLSGDMDRTERVVDLLKECRDLEIEVLPPNINRSEYYFTVHDGAILYGLGAIKGLGSTAVNSIIAERNKNGAFKTIFDLCRRVDRTKINRRTWEVLIYSGSFDCFERHRAQLFSDLELALQAAQQTVHAQGDLFGHSMCDIKAVDVAPWDQTQTLQSEKEVLGIYLSAHPFEPFESELQKLTTASLKQLNPNQTAVVAGWIVSLRTFLSKKGDRMAILRLQDRTDQLEVTIFSDLYKIHRENLQPDRLLIVEGELTRRQENLNLLAKKIFNFTDARTHYAKGVLIHLMQTSCDFDLIQKLRAQLEDFRPGALPITIQYQKADQMMQLELGSAWRIQARDDFLPKMQQLLGSQKIEIVYSD
jgi:DNA polymerase III subunit alpha